MKSLAVVIVASFLAASCSGGMTSPSLAAGVHVGSADALQAKGGKPDVTGDWLLPITFTSVSAGCGGSPVVGTTFTEQISVTEQGSAVIWQVTAETERYKGKMQGNGSFIVIGDAAADTEGQQFVGQASSTSMTGQFSYAAAPCAIEGTFAARRP